MEEGEKGSQVLESEVEEEGRGRRWMRSVSIVLYWRQKVSTVAGCEVR